MNHPKSSSTSNGDFKAVYDVIGRGEAIRNIPTRSCATLLDYPGTTRWTEGIEKARLAAKKFDRDCVALCVVQRKMEQRVPWRGEYARTMNPKVREALAFMDVISRIVADSISGEAERQEHPITSKLERAASLFNQAADRAAQFKVVVNNWADQEDEYFLFQSGKFNLNFQDVCFTHHSLERFLEMEFLTSNEMTFGDLSAFTKQADDLTVLFPGLVDKYRQLFIELDCLKQQVIQSHSESFELVDFCHNSLIFPKAKSDCLSDCSVCMGAIDGKSMCKDITKNESHHDVSNETDVINLVNRVVFHTGTNNSSVITNDTEVEISCGHRFHRNCLSGWIWKGKLTCPMCRTCFSSDLKFKNGASS
eukprot:GHVL01024812.1.p1 GENE.GHVL01024812.1~~GHVL01024812.1.p1  ORF type:complete len:364 (+),score=35.09 GHVL01024812.1:114-1205(+)